MCQWCLTPRSASFSRSQTHAMLAKMSAPPSPPSKSTPSSKIPPSLKFTYPYASSPDIIRANQKDTYFHSLLHSQLSTILRRLYGVRFTHSYDGEAQTFSELLYLGLTTFVGNRTLGEEYCEIIQLDTSPNGGRAPSVTRRAGYIISAVLLPYGLGRILPSLRARIRLRLEGNLVRRRKWEGQGPKDALTKVQEYVLDNLGELTSLSPIYAVSLATFYFTGAYYHLSKRLWGLRYILTKRVSPEEQRNGYEVLGLLLALQMVVQGAMHLRGGFKGFQMPATHIEGPEAESSAVLNDGIGFDDEKASVNLRSAQAKPRSRLEISTHTPLPEPEKPRYGLEDTSTMNWIQGSQQRKCTLCLEEMKDPSATTCGHVFCWSCIEDWIREKPECPLCRQAVLGQHVLPLRC